MLDGVGGAACDVRYEMTCANQVSPFDPQQWNIGDTLIAADILGVLRSVMLFALGQS